MSTFPADQISRIKSNLQTTGLSNKNPPLFQVIDQLIDTHIGLVGDLNTHFSPGDSTGIGNQSFITINDDSVVLPNSVRLIAGPGIRLNRDRTLLTVSVVIPVSRGETGEKGERGLSGKDGVAGAAGVAGVIGKQGPRGFNGEDSNSTPSFRLPNPITGKVWFEDDVTLKKKLHLVGDFDINTNKFTVTASSGNTIIAGIVAITGNFSINSTKFTVNATTGDASIEGLTTAFGGVIVGVNKVILDNSAGNVTAKGTFDLTGIASFQSNLNFTVNNKFLSGATVAGPQSKLIGVNAADKVSIDTDALGALFGAGLKVAAPINLKGYTVAGLPAGVIGDTAYVTDALAPVFLAAIVGGGAVVTAVFFDGVNWTAQ